MGITSTILKTLIGNGAKQSYARTAIDAGKTMALKYGGKPAFHIKKLMGGQFGKTEGRLRFDNLKSGTHTVFKTDVGKDGNTTHSMFVKFGENNKAAKRMGLAGLEKFYDNSGKYLKTEYIFVTGAEKFGGTTIQKHSFYTAKPSEARPILSIINYASKVLPESIKSSNLGALIKSLAGLV